MAPPVAGAITWVVGLLVGAAMIASSVATLVFAQHGPHFLANAAQAASVASPAVAAVLVIYLGQMIRRRRQNPRE